MNIKSELRSAVNVAAKLVGPETILKVEAFLRFQKKINLKHPQSLSEKICYLELKTENPLVVKCADKYEVREYVRGKGLEELLVPLIGEVYSNADEIEFNKLPSKFVLKATYGCKMNLICEHKDLLDISAAKKTVNGWLSKGFNRDALEPHYQKIKKRIICETFLEGADSILDYKIHCLNGEPKFVLVCSERSETLKLNLYNLNWEPIHEICGSHLNDKEIEKPSQLNRMLEIAKILSEDFEFVRVDLYQIGEKVYI